MPVSEFPFSAYLLTLLVSVLGRELTLYISVYEFEAVKRILLERRRALGKRAKIRLLEHVV